MVQKPFRAAALAALFFVGCSSSDQTSSSKEAEKPGSTGSITASVGHRDERLGLPSFVWINRSSAPRFADARVAAELTMQGLAETLGLEKDASAAVHATEIDEHAHGPIVARFAQRIRGIEVFRGQMSLALTRAYEPVAATGMLVPSVAGTERAYVFDEAEAATRGIRLVTGMTPHLRATEARGGYERFEAAGLFAPSRVKKVFFPTKGTRSVGLEPAYYVEVMMAAGPSVAYVLSGIDGRVLFRHDLTRNAEYSYRVFADPTTKLPWDGPQGNGFAPHPAGKPDGTKLTFEQAQVVTLQNYPFSKNDPWLPDGATTTTVGNNVQAYADIAQPDGFQGGDLAGVATGTSFDHVFDPTKSPKLDNGTIQGSATQLFYVGNFLHDWFYDAGYDEKSGNHQSNNFDRGGVGADPLLIEAQDYSGRNNANAAVPPDGQSPRIQMFIWGGPVNASLVVNSPASIAGTKSVGVASGFGKDTFDLTGNVVLGQDGTGDTYDACEDLANDVEGKIVLVHRGTCAFAQKAQKVQEAGGVGMILANVATSQNPTFPPPMGGQTQATITIPLLSLNLADGQALEAALTAGVNVTMKRSANQDLDGSLDTAIVAHEWGHVLSNRLIANAMGLTTNQAGGLGEGWGDFLSVLLLVREDDPDAWNGAYGQGSYATSGAGSDIYFGTRRYPYSIDLAKNPLTFKHIQNGVQLPTTAAISFGEEGGSNAEVHNAGEVWATMLWEVYAALLRDPRYSFKDAQDRMKRYLVAGMKLTPADPTFLEARDGLLAAAYATDEQDFQLMWQAFARRGAGAGAVGPEKESRTNAGVVESFFAGNDVGVAEVKLVDDVISCDHDNILDAEEVGTIEVKVRNTGSGVLSGATATLKAKTEGVTITEGANATIQPLKPFETAVVKLKAQVRGPKAGEPIDLTIEVADPSLPEGKVLNVAVPTRFNADEAEASSALDGVETVKTAWKVSEVDPSGYGEKWSRKKVDGNTIWFVPDIPIPSEQILASPGFTIAETTFSLKFRHRWSFRRSARRNADQDGGVIEITTDDGKTWTDLNELGDVNYNSTLDTGGRGDNPLKGRKAFGSKSPGYPKEWVTTNVDVTLPEHPEEIKIRFRTGAGSGFSGAEGWEIDDIELVGITSTPFYAYIPHTDQCDPNGPTVFVNPAQTVRSGANVALQGGGTHPANLPLTFIWTQESGPAVTLTDPASPTPSFEAPSVTEPTTITLALRAHDGKLLSAAARTEVTIDNNAGDDGACGCRTASTRSTGRNAIIAMIAIALAFVRRRRR